MYECKYEYEYEYNPVTVLFCASLLWVSFCTVLLTPLQLSKWYSTIHIYQTCINNYLLGRIVSLVTKVSLKSVGGEHVQVLLGQVLAVLKVVGARLLVALLQSLSHGLESLQSDELLSCVALLGLSDLLVVVVVDVVKRHELGSLMFCVSFCLARGKITSATLWSNGTAIPRIFASGSFLNERLLAFSYSPDIFVFEVRSLTW